VGAGPAGLAVAGCLGQRGTEAVVLERGAAVGASWRRHYDRLHLHTSVGFSRLPGLSFPKGTQRYPSRDEVVAYFEAYVRRFALRVETGREVAAVEPLDGGWAVRSGEETISARHVVLATGLTDRPLVPAWPGLDGFPGPFLHSSEYKNGEPYRDRTVLVVGFGNSGGELALDLAEHGARPILSVRGPVNIVPRDLLGVPILAVGIVMSKLPPRLADALATPLQRWTIGDYGALGLRKSRRGPNRQLREDGRVPLLDIGTVALLRRGGATARPAIESFDGASVRFVDGTVEKVDAVIAATGFRAAVAPLLGAVEGVLDERGVPFVSGAESAAPGLWFCGYRVAATGFLREAGIEARRIARDIATRERGAA